MVAGVQTYNPFVVPNKSDKTVRNDRNGSEFEDASDEARNGRIEHTIERNETAIGLSQEFDYLYPDEFFIAYPEAEDHPDLIHEGDEVEFLTEDRMESIRGVKDLIGDAQKWGDIPEEVQNEIRGVISQDLMAGARHVGHNEQQLDANLAERKQDFNDYLPDIEGLDAVIGETHDNVQQAVDEVMTDEMRAAIAKGMDPDNPDWSDFKTLLTETIDNEVDDPELRGDRSEEDVFRDFTGLLLVFGPGESTQMQEQIDVVGTEILVNRPVAEIKAAYNQDDSFGDAFGEFFTGDEDPIRLLKTLDEKTQTDRAGQPMSAARVNDIINACESELTGALEHLNGGDRKNAVDHLNRIAMRASSEDPSKDTGVQLLAKLLVDQGLMDKPTSPRYANQTFHGRFRESVRDGNGPALALQVAAEYARRGETDEATRIQQETLADIKTFFESTGETTEEFKRIFKDDVEIVNGTLSGYVSPQEGQAGLDNLNERLIEENQDLYDQFYHNQQGIISTLAVLEHMPEELGTVTMDDSGLKAEEVTETIDGYADLVAFHDETIGVLQSNQCLADADAYDYQKNLQFAVFGGEYNAEEATGLSADTRQLFADMPDSFYSDILAGYDEVASGQAGGGDDTRPPIPTELAELRAELGDNPAEAAEALKNNPQAAFAFSQYLYLYQQSGNPQAEDVPSMSSPGFLTRAAWDQVVDVVEKQSPYLKPGLTGQALPVKPGIQGATQQELRRMQGNWIGWQLQKGLPGRRIALIDGARDMWYNARSDSARFPAEGSIYRTRWGGPTLGLARAGLAAWGAKDFWPKPDKMIPGTDNFDPDEFTNGIWGPWFAIDATNRVAGVAGIKSLVVEKWLGRALPPMMGILVANELRKGDYAMAAAWTPALAASIIPFLSSAPWAAAGGPIVIGLWVVSAAAALGLSQYRHVEASNHYEDPMKWYLEGAGYSPDRAHNMGNTTGDGEIRYPLLNGAAESYFGMDTDDLGRVFRDEDLSDENLGRMVELTHYLDFEPDGHGRLPAASELSESDKYILSAIYRLIPDQYKTEPAPLFADGNMPELWDGGMLPWDDNKFLAGLDLENLLPWEERQLPMGTPWSNDMYKQQPERVQEIISSIYWEQGN